MMSPEKSQTLQVTVEALRNIPNVAALALGGSHATGLATEASDLDIGVYYRESAPFDIERIRDVAASIRLQGSPLAVTDFYGWGHWVNGGAWIQTAACKIDLLYKNLDQLERVIDESRSGVWRHDFDQQPPYGFRSVVYLGEARCCVPLHDPAQEITKLKAAVAVYPEPLKRTIVRDGLWGAEFSLWACGGYVESGDVLNAAGCMTRAAHFLTQMLFAWNGEYFLNDKHVKRILPAFSNAPANCVTRLEEILARPSTRDSFEAMCRLWKDAVALTNGAYVPRFDLTAAK